MGPDKLLVAASQDRANYLRKVLGLGADWFVVGYGGALTGRRFNRAVLFDLGEPRASLAEDHRQIYIDRIVRLRMLPDAEMVHV